MVLTFEDLVIKTGKELVEGGLMDIEKWSVRETVEKREYKGVIYSSTYVS